MIPGRVHHATRSASLFDESNDAGDSHGDSLQPTTSSSFSCDQCSKAFSRRENLSRHLKTHDVLLSHRCSKCNKAFTRSDLLKRHERGHERWDKEGPARSGGNAKRKRVDFEEPAIPKEFSCHDLSRSSPELVAPSENADDHLPNSGGQSVSATRSFEHQPFTSLQGVVHPGLPNEGQEILHHYDSNEYLPSGPFGAFDFSSFLIPPNTDPDEMEWFSHDFYSAMRETGNEWGDQGELFDPNFLSPGQEATYTPTDIDFQSFEAHGPRPELQHSVGKPYYESNKDRLSGQGRISRISSPPNEASEEDKWPFQWNPNSRPILKANRITIPDHHPLLKNHDSRFDISELTLSRLQAFLKPPAGREFHQSQKGSFFVPSLIVVNVFIGLFFEHFSPQMPVLHHPTVNTNTDLPPPLLAAMMIIGAIYSHLKHTRRFSIVLLDIIRWNLQIALECDNSLMRQPMIIYAEALICHTGLWCGNKRAFELAEVVRGAAVTYIRRKHIQDHGISTSQQATADGNINSQWRNWVSNESQRRLYWVIFALDAQFPALLNLPATIAIGEMSDFGCPCDEEFWCASSARNWKNLLGPASVPPSRYFSAAVGPFVLSPCFKAASNQKSVHRQQIQSPILDLNPWSSFLVLMTIQSQIFQLSQDSLLARTFIDDDETFFEGCDKQQSHDWAQSSAGDIGSNLRDLQNKRREQIAEALSSWHRSYSNPRSHAALHRTSQHFHAASIVVYHLSTILLHIELSDLQNAIGKDGTAGMSQALLNLKLWARKSPRVAESVAFDAVTTIISLAPSRSLNDDSAPYSIITLFLCHIVLWVFATVSPHSERRRLLESIGGDMDLPSNHFYDIVRKSMSLNDASDESTRTEAPKILFKSGAEMLTQLGTWGASLNLALLIHSRADMQ